MSKYLLCFYMFVHLSIRHLCICTQTQNSENNGSNHIYRSSCRNDALFKLTDRNKKLSGQASNLIASSHVKSLSMCVKVCVQPSNCRSINYKVEPTSNTDHNCQLLDITKNDSSSQLSDAVGWKHYEPVSQRSPRCKLVACNPGFSCIDSCDNVTGYVCNEIDECLSNPCQNGGNCKNLVNSYQCTCAPGWLGTNCQTDFEECASNPCQNGGECAEADQANGYTCTCAAGYTGKHCETNIAECASNPCQHGGSCADGVNRYTCTCASGYTGIQCEIDINECASNPCKNGGGCADGINKYNCTCVAGYAGQHCETNIDECASNPCQNGGGCVDGINKYNCTCVAGYAGQHCETKVDACFSSPCRNGGSCMVTPSGYSCICAGNYGGIQCQQVAKISSCLQLKNWNGYTENGVFTLWDKAASYQYNAYCDMQNGGWTLIARFSNADVVNWVKTSGSYWYDETEAGQTTSPSENTDMLNKAFYNVRGKNLKITRTDNSGHGALVTTTSNCFGGQHFRAFITQFGNFRNGASWGFRDNCTYSCQVTYHNEYASTEGFIRAGCSGTLQSSNNIGFWCHFDTGDGAVLMIGGGGTACGRADHGLAVTEYDNPMLGTSMGAGDFGNDGGASKTSSYALNLWVI